jgi:hypothetical protein
VEAATIDRSEVAGILRDTLTDADREQFEDLTALYRVLGHIGPREDYEDLYLEFATAAVIGFYSLPAKALYVVGDSLEFSELSIQERSVLAHELVHAIQAGATDLPATLERSASDLDWSMALSAVVEGDAVFHERQWLLTQMGVPPGSTASTSVSGTRVPPSLERAFRFPYEAGLDWVAIEQPRRGNEAINGVLRGRRITTAEILHPDLYESNFEPAAVAVPEPSGSGEGFDWVSAALGAAAVGGLILLLVGFMNGRGGQGVGRIGRRRALHT